MSPDRVFIDIVCYFAKSRGKNEYGIVSKNFIGIFYLYKYLPTHLHKYILTFISK